MLQFLGLSFLLLFVACWLALAWVFGRLLAAHLRLAPPANERFVALAHRVLMKRYDERRRRLLEQNKHPHA